MRVGKLWYRNLRIRFDYVYLSWANVGVFLQKKALAYQVETLKREIASALHDRDKALKEVNDLRQRGGEFKDRNQMEGVKTRFDSAYRERYDIYIYVLVNLPFFLT